MKPELTDDEDIRFHCEVMQWWEYLEQDPAWIAEQERQLANETEEVDDNGTHGEKA